MTETTDLAPTLCEILDLKPLPGMHGESLFPIIESKKRKEAVFADGGHEEELLLRFRDKTLNKDNPKWNNNPNWLKNMTYKKYPDTMARAKMVRTDRYKMVIRLKGGNELYDLKKDPWELNNCWDEPGLSEVKMDLMIKLINWSLKTDTDLPYQDKVTV